jgi:integrase
MAKWTDGVALRGKTWWIRAAHEGETALGSVKKFAFLLEPHQPIPTTKTDTVMLRRRVVDWLVRGKPMPTPVVEAAPVVELHGYDLINRWVTATKKKQSAGDVSKERSAQRRFGALLLSQWQDQATFRRYVEEMLAAGFAIATPNRILAAIVRPAVNWGINQEPPLLMSNPFGRYRFKIDIKAENKRTERCDPDIEAQLLAACYGPLATARHKGAGPALADYIVLGIDLGAREGELLRLANRDVDWHGCTVTLRKTKRGEIRVVPFNPKGRVAEILKRRRFAGPSEFVITTRKVFKLWVQAVCHVFDIPCEYRGRGKYFTEETIEAYKAANLRPHDFRHETATWWGLCGVSDATANFVQGHKSQSDTHGRYKHEELRLAKQELAEKVWPREGERAQRAQARAAGQ